MTGSESILNKEPEELERLLLEAARRDGAPRAARERALLTVTSVALGVGVASSAAAFGTPTSIAKASGWLVAKWLVAGFGSGILTLAVVQGVQQLAVHPAPFTASAAVAKAAPPGKRALRVASAPEQRSITPLGDTPAGPPPSAPAEASAALATPRSVISAASVVRGSAGRPAPPSSAPRDAQAPHANASQPNTANEPSSLTRELSLLEQARRALVQGAAARALQALNEYRAQFPNGSLQAEAAALRVEAVGQAGDHALARQQAAAFLSSYPTSPLAARVRALSGSFGSDLPKP